MARCLALEVALIRVNRSRQALSTRRCRRRCWATGIGELREQLRTTLPIGRVVGPADIASLAVHLMTNTAVTGATFDIADGQQLIGARVWHR
jgi:NAD(P)-dependent dehydrogenase (short-subunit alcohol dehydrogenase family)